MLRTWNDLGLPAPLAISVVIACIVMLIYAMRAHQRRLRRQSRRRADRLSNTFARFLDYSASPEELRRVGEEVGDAAFWTALEACWARLRRAEWLRISRALERSRHASAERRALRDDSPWRRVLAARRLALLRSRASRRALREALVRGPEIVTYAAALSLGHYRDRGALRWLLAHSGVLALRPPRVLTGLLQSFGPAALPDLTVALERDIDGPHFERAIIETLGIARFHGGRAAIERRLEADNSELRIAAARALGELRAIESATSLLGALKDPEWPVRAQAARALGRVSAPIAVYALAARLTDRAWWVRHHSAYALVALGEEGRMALREVVASSPDPYARDIAREALEAGPKSLSA